MKIYNSLSSQVEAFKPLTNGRVQLYTCGPTVYNYLTIGNWRTYVLGDLLYRSLEYFDYEVDYVMNITDVGHLTGDNLGDASMGEDRMEKAARKEGRSAWDIAEFYTEDFLEGFRNMRLQEPRVFCKATEHINEQIQLVQDIEKAGFTYTISDGVYFDVKAYEAEGHTYGELSSLDQIKEGARVEKNEEKKDPRDFALWKFSPKDEKRQMEWDSPWGRGFPGWHIECSAMSMKYLGKQFDVHVGGEDLKSTHHPNEIAQSEAATGKRPFVNYWVHGAFLTVDGGRMGKSLGNAYTLHDVIERGYSPLDLRYFYLTGHYRKQLNFTWEALEAARDARRKLVMRIERWLEEGVVELRSLKGTKAQEFERQFADRLADDLSMPEVLRVTWEMVKSGIDEAEKLYLVEQFDRVLGLSLLEEARKIVDVPDAVKQLADEREAQRKKQHYAKADALRSEIEKAGYEVEDTDDGPRLVKKR